MEIELIKAVNFSNFYEKIKNQKLPFNLAHSFFQLKKELDSHISFYYEKINEIIFEFGEKDEKGELIPTEDGTGIKIKKEKSFLCQEKINELSNIKIEIKDYHFNTNDLSILEVSIEDLYDLIPLIKI